MDSHFREAALDYHRHPRPGKIEVVATKPLSNQRDLALAYTPGVAAACEEIVRDPSTADTLSSRANLVGVINNGTAVLGIGGIGPILLGCRGAVNIRTPAASVRRIVNMTALAVVDTNAPR